MNKSDVLIVGAGIAGLLCAVELHRAGLRVRVLDKGRGFGGRMATRRMGGGRIDHGAQYFTVREPRFQRYVDGWLEAGVVCEWFRHLPEDSNPEGYPRYRGANGMTDVPKALAAEVDVRREQRVVSLARETDGWRAETVSGACFHGSRLVLATPLPQSLMLLDTSGVRFANGKEEALRAVHYEKGLATLAILDGPSGLPAPGGVKIREAPLTWIADNRMKGISPEVHAITLHADPEFSETHWDSPDAVRGPLMLEAAGGWLASDVVEYACHRWGFTTPVNPWPERYFMNEGLGLLLTGDAFGGRRVEGAALSGLAASDAILAVDRRDAQP